MADRVVKVTLNAQVSNYVAGFKQAKNASTDLTQQLADQQQAMTQVGAGLTAIGAIAAVGVGLAVKKFADFDQAMSNVKAATQETSDNMGKLRDASLDAGARTVFSAIEAANAVEELGKAGLETTDILNGGLDGALDLASAGQLGVAEAAGIAATALKTFNLRGSDMSHVADLLAAGAGKAMGDVSDLSQALNQAGLVANSTGLSIEETTGTLAAFASKGLLGSDAGTSFKSMLQRLTPQSKEAQAAMDELGISAYDASGEFIGMAKFAGVLEEALKDKTTQERQSAMSTIFGSDAVRAATVLYTEGADGIAEWINKVDDSGYAAKVAADRLDNLKGDVEALGGAFDTALIKSGSAADGSLRFLTQAATELVDVFNDAHPAVQQAVLVLGGLTAAAGLAGGAFLLGVPKVAEFSLALATLTQSQIPAVASSALLAQTAIAKMSTTMSAAAKFAMGPWGIALLAATIGIKALTDYVDSLKASSDEMTNSLIVSKDAAEVFATAMQGRNEWFQNFAGAKNELSDLDTVLETAARQATNWWERIGNSSNFKAEAALEAIGKDLGQLASADLPSAQKAFSLLAKETDGTDKQLWRLLSTMPDYKDALVAQATAQGINVTTDNEALNKKRLLELANGSGAAAALKAADAALKVAEAEEAATKASEEWRKEISELDASFVDVQGAYDSIVEKNKAVAESTASSTKSTKDSWENFYDGVTVKIADYLGELQKQVDAQNNWESNMVRMAGRVSQGTLDELARMGPEGAPLVAQLVNASDEELARMETLFGERATGATGTFATHLANSQAVIGAASAQLGAEAAREIAEKLANGTSTVEQIMKDYKLEVESTNPIVTVNTSDAQARVDKLTNAFRTISGAELRPIQKGDGSMLQPVWPKGAAYGGTVTGVGTSKSDSNLYRLSVGEEVIQEPYASRNRALLKQINSGAFHGFANGGTAGYAQPRYATAPQVIRMESGGRGGGDINVPITVTAQNVDPHELSINIRDQFNWELRGR